MQGPVGGAALRLLHLWAAASYHHGWRPTVAFAFEEPELPMAPELRLVLDVPWGHSARHIEMRTFRAPLHQDEIGEWGVCEGDVILTADFRLHICWGTPLALAFEV